MCFLPSSHLLRTVTTINQLFFAFSALCRLDNIVIYYVLERPATPINLLRYEILNNCNFRIRIKDVRNSQLNRLEKERFDQARHRPTRRVRLAIRLIKRPLLRHIIITKQRYIFTTTSLHV